MPPRWPFVVLALLQIAVVVEVNGHCSFVTQRIQCQDLSCNETSGECVPCTTDESCYNSAFGCVAGKCGMKSLKDSFKWTTIFAPLSAFIVCGVAVLAGVGGGAILVTLYSFILGVPMADAVGLSQATICGQSILNVFLQLRRHHPSHSPPLPTRPNINFEYCALLLPLALTGTLIGSIASKVSPDWLRVVLLIVLFSYVLVRLIRRVLSQRARDREEKLVQQQVEGSDDDDNRDSKRSPTQEPGVKYGYSSIQENAKNPAEKSQYPLRWLLAILFLFVVFSFFSYAKSHMVTCGSNDYIFVVVGCVAFGIVSTIAIRQYLAHLHEKVITGELEDSVVPFDWSIKTTVVFPIICIVAGFAASMLGIGGGLVCVSLLLEAGLHPEHSSATGGFITLLIAVQAAADYALAGELRWDFGVMLFAAGVLSAAFGQFVLMREIKKRGWLFLIVAALATIMGGSMLSVCVFGVYNTIIIEQHHGSLGFAPLC